jgi:hypothetical protein
MYLSSGDESASAYSPLPGIEAGEAIHCGDVTGRLLTKFVSLLASANGTDTVRANRECSMAANQTHSPETTSLSSELSAERALGMIGMGLMQKLNQEGPGRWIWSDTEDGGAANLVELRQRLELTSLAIKTGAPLSTAEVTQLLGIRPGSEQVERGGLRASRLSRNVWRLTQIGMDSSQSSSGLGDDRFRRRL